MSYGAVAGIFFILSAMALALFYKNGDFRWRTVAFWFYTAGIFTGVAGAFWWFIK